MPGILPLLSVWLRGEMVDPGPRVDRYRCDDDLIIGDRGLPRNYCMEKPETSDRRRVRGRSSLCLVRAALELRGRIDRLHFGAPVTHVYNPLAYAWEPHRAYLESYGKGTREVLLVGMNPGPWGMVQTGVPFGDVEMVRDWLNIDGRVESPGHVHPRRPVLGFDCSRREGSGRRLWTWASDRFGSPEAFFSRFFVGNYCPLAFFCDDAGNLTPDKLPLSERRALQEVCDQALRETVATMRPAWVLGIGRFAERRVAAALAGSGIRVGGVPHPSPASPQANRGWAEQMDLALRAAGIDVA